MMNKANVLCLMGPTASGKTACALDLAERLPVEIINVDSAQIYKGLDIGSAKPSADVLTKIPHHLIDIRDPTEVYSAADFVVDATACIQDILSRGSYPVLVGGTMLYFHALQFGLNALPQSSPEVRTRLQSELAQRGHEALHAQLAEIDPVRAAQLHPNDTQRLLRALEIHAITGLAPSALTEPQTNQTPAWAYVNIAFNPQDRSQLHAMIEKRFDDMLAQGFEEEVKALFAREGLNLALPAIRAVGYRQMWQYLAGEYAFETMREKAIVATRQLAKRQITWLNQWPDCHRFDLYHPKLLDDILALV